MSATLRLFSIVLAACGVFTTTAHAAEPLQVAPREGVLLLRNQNVLRGKISRVADHYVVAVPGGEIRVRDSEVELFCQDLDEGYRRKRAALEPGSAAEHLALAEWCLRQGLLGYAAKEVIDARAADPTHPKIALFERRLHAAARADTSHDLDRPQPRATPRVPSAKKLEQMVRRLPSGAVEVFTNTVQPLLLNSCSTAACHGPRSGRAMHFERTGGRTISRRLTQRNLYTVLQQIDQDHPDHSRLLLKARAPHVLSVKAGRTALLQRQQYRRLVDWVRMAITREPPKAATVDKPSAELLQTIPGVVAPRSAPQQSKGLPDPDTSNRAGGQNTKSAGKSKSKSKKRSGSRLLKPRPRAAAGGAAPKDPFDPAIFNRLDASAQR